MSKASIIRQEIQSEIDALSRVEHHVETNQGTYGETEARRKVGCGEPQFANREVYETVAGERREVGPDEGDAPGYMRQINREALSADRKRLADLRSQLRSAR